MDKSRQQFEEWRSKNKSSTINLFDVWQASRESLINSLEPVGYAAEIDINEIEIYGELFLNEDPTEEINIPLYRLDK